MLLHDSPSRLSKQLEVYEFPNPFALRYERRVRFAGSEPRALARLLGARDEMKFSSGS